MTAGVPGTGIGGLFYLMAALILPLRGLLKRARGVHVPWPVIVRQVGLALGVLAGIWGTGWLLGLLLGPVVMGVGTGFGAKATASREFANVLRWAVLLAGFATLAVVLLSVQIARLLFGRKK